MKKKICAVLTLAIMLALSMAPAAWAADLPKLSAPTDLQWGGSGYAEGITSMLSWKFGETQQNEYSINIYRRNGAESVPVRTEQTYKYTGSVIPERAYFPLFWAVDGWESGTYYFTLVAKGDGVQYADSDAVTSPDFVYTKPAGNLAASFSNLHWEAGETPVACWDISNAGTGFSDRYQIRFWYAATQDDTPEQCGLRTIYKPLTENKLAILPSYIQNKGEGYYYFKVRALSDDINVYNHGEWSALSPAYNVTEIAETVDDKLDNLLSNSQLSGSAVNAAVQQLDKNELKLSMLADKNNSGTVNTLAGLEEKTGVGLNIIKANDFNGFAGEGIEVVGARLNNLGADTKNVTLEVGKPKNQHDVLPTQYDNTVAVNFSMDLVGVQDTENLQVPVKITLPVPENINPDFLVILHYKANSNDFEAISNADYSFIDKAGKKYVTFVLTSFSDFVMTQTANANPEESAVKIVLPDYPQGVPDNLKPGDTLQAKANVNGLSSKDVNWTSSDKTVATVDANGLVTIVGYGKSNIRATSVVDNTKYATFRVVVTDGNKPNVPVTGVTLNETALNLEVGGTATLQATVAPANATNKKVAWSSSNEKVATVNADGKVNALAAGTATITVTTEDGKKTAACTVTVTDKKIPVTGITLNKTALTMEVKTSAQLKATVLPADTTSKISWTSSNEKVATVDNTGKVTALTKGTAQITAAADGIKASCNVTVTADNVYTITFDTDGGTLAAGITNPDYVIKGESYKMPGASKSRYTLTAWAIGDKDSKTQAKANEVYTFTEDTTVYAIWQYNGGGGGSHGGSSKPGGTTTTKPGTPGGAEKPGNTEKPGTTTSNKTVTAANVNNKFADVQNNAWYSEAIAYVYNKGMMNGTDAGKFEPNATTTRAMLVTMLYRLEGEPKTGAADFSDVASGQWFSEAIAWAAANGVVNGYENGTFAPNAAITREQLAVILWRYAGSPAASAELNFSDAATVSDWAQQAMQWAVSVGIINGDNGALRPAGNATRAEVAMMLMRFCEK